MSGFPDAFLGPQSAHRDANSTNHPSMRSSPVLVRPGREEEGVLTAQTSRPLVSRLGSGQLTVSLGALGLLSNLAHLQEHIWNTGGNLKNNAL